MATCRLRIGDPGDTRPAFVSVADNDAGRIQDFIRVTGHKFTDQGQLSEFLQTPRRDIGKFAERLGVSPKLRERL